MHGNVLGGRTSQCKAPGVERLGGVQSTARDQTGLENRMGRGVMMRLGEQGPDRGGPGGPGRSLEVTLSTVGSKGRVFDGEVICSDLCVEKVTQGGRESG